MSSSGGTQAIAMLAPQGAGTGSTCAGSEYSALRFLDRPLAAQSIKVASNMQAVEDKIGILRHVLDLAQKKLMEDQRKSLALQDELAALKEELQATRAELQSCREQKLGALEDNQALRHALTKEKNTIQLLTEKHESIVKEKDGHLAELMGQQMATKNERERVLFENRQVAERLERSEEEMEKLRNIVNECMSQQEANKDTLGLCASESDKLRMSTLHLQSTLSTQQSLNREYLMALQEKAVQLEQKDTTIQRLNAECLKKSQQITDLAAQRDVEKARADGLLRNLKEAEDRETVILAAVKESSLKTTNMDEEISNTATQAT